MCAQLNEELDKLVQANNTMLRSEPHSLEKTAKGTLEAQSVAD